VQIPDKLYFKIGEVARIAGVKPYVVRYWETEFGALRPEKTRSGQRLYKRHDVQKLLDIKRLLREEGYTIAGARRRLRGEAVEEQRPGAGGPSGPRPVGGSGAVIEQVRREVRDLLAIVDADGRDADGEE
jgi:DNA-binding transcriptional MerR regulator